jgi:hypothetical protein
MNFFTDENIIEPLIRYYKSFEYVNYILNLSFKDGFKLYLKCINLMKEDLEKELKDNVRQVWLIEIQNGYKGDFESYYKSKIKVSENKTFGKDFRHSEETRIIKDINSKENIKLKERVYNL